MPTRALGFAGRPSDCSTLLLRHPFPLSLLIENPRSPAAHRAGRTQDNLSALGCLRIGGYDFRGSGLNPALQAQQGDSMNLFDGGVALFAGSMVQASFEGIEDRMAI